MAVVPTIIPVFRISDSETFGFGSDPGLRRLFAGLCELSANSEDETIRSRDEFGLRIFVLQDLGLTCATIDFKRAGAMPIERALATSLGCQRSGEALIIDPERDIDRYKLDKKAHFS